VKIPQVSPWITDADSAAILEPLQRGWITEGQESQQFVAEFEALIGQRGVLAPNGTLALVMAMQAANVGPGDEVLVSDTTFFGSATAIMSLGAIPIPVPVDDVFYQMRVERLPDFITDRTVAIMPVHLYGNACQIKPIVEFAEANGLWVIEDAAQGVGVLSCGQNVGTFGHFGTFSFFADKTITTGEGGFVTARGEESLNRLLLLRNQGRLDRGSFVHDSFGINYRITDMQAALGRSQLARLESIIKRKREIRTLYHGYLHDLDDVSLLDEPVDTRSVPFRVVMQSPSRERIVGGLAEAGVQTRSTFFPLHKQPGLRSWLEERGRRPPSAEPFEASRRHFECGICLPAHVTMSDDDVAYVCDSIRSVLQG